MIELGEVLLTKVGQQLAQISGGAPVPDFFEEMVRRWQPDRSTASDR
jgi:hypothetical protein